MIAPASPPDPDTAPAAGRPLFEQTFRFFLRPILPLREDRTITEIIVNGPGETWIERDSVLESSPHVFTRGQLRAAVTHIAQYVDREFGPDHPILDARLEDGSRICIVHESIAHPGPTINIRTFPAETPPPEQLLRWKSLTPAALEVLQAAVGAHCNILVSGIPGSGKTTLLNVLSSAIRSDERLIVIEDTRELRLAHAHVVQMEARPARLEQPEAISMRELVKASLRMRGDRLLVGEVRGPEALDLLQALSSGHRGTMSTIHASSPAGACARLETLTLMADAALPAAAVRRQIADAVDIVVQTQRWGAQRRRLVTAISEVEIDDAGERLVMRDIFRLERERNSEATLAWTGVRPAFATDPLWTRPGRLSHAEDILLGENT